MHGTVGSMDGFRDAELLAQQARYDVVFELLRISHVLPLYERLKGWRKVVWHLMQTQWFPFAAET